jgi:hypothetical protein
MKTKSRLRPGHFIFGPSVEKLMPNEISVKWAFQQGFAQSIATLTEYLA